jgi:hypothetical protein
MRKVIALLGACSIGVGLAMLFVGNPWDKSLLWIMIGVVVLMEYRDHKSNNFD